MQRSRSFEDEDDGGVVRPGKRPEGEDEEEDDDVAGDQGLSVVRT